MEIIINIKGLELVTAAISELATAISVKKTEIPPSVMSIPTTQTTVAAVVPQCTPIQPPAATVPTTHVAHEITQDQLGRALCTARDMGRMDIVQKIFGLFGVSTMMEIPHERYGEVLVMLRTEGIAI